MANRLPASNEMTSVLSIRPLDKGSHIPLYLQLTAQLTDMIQTGQLTPNFRLPSERELSEMLNVSRITTRLALQELLESGLVYREQGRGTFVAEPKMRGVQGFASFTEDMRNRGLVPGSKILQQELVGVDENLAHTLHIQSGEQAIHLVRLRLADRRPVAVQSAYLPGRMFPGLENEALEDRSLFDVLRQKYVVHPAWTEAAVEASSATPEQARLLEIKSGEPVLIVRGLTFTESFDVVESVRTIYPGKGLGVYIGRQRLENVKIR
ncbi:MAG: GntR family transcriptional regulator [Bacteroidota bacterium]